MKRPQFYKACYRRYCKITSLYIFLLQANQKLDKAASAADDSERMKKVLENKSVEDEKRIDQLDQDLKNARNRAEEADAR